MRNLVTVFAALVWCVGLGAQDNRPPSPEELATGLKTAKLVTVLDGGQVVDQVSVSRDGRWLAYAYHGDDIKSNFLRLVATDGRMRKEIDAPRGFKNTPVVWSDRLLFFTLDSPQGSAFPDGIYQGLWEGPASRWTVFEAGSFRNLSLSEDGRFLAAATGDFDRPTTTISVKIWPLGAAGTKAGNGYTVGTGVKGRVRQIAWGPEAQSLVVEINIEKPGLDWGQSNLYSTENRPGAVARLLRENGRRPVLWNQNGTAVLFFNEGDWQRSRVLSVRPGDRTESVVATLDNQDGEGLTANAMAWDPAGRRLILGVQASATAAGLVGFSPP